MERLCFEHERDYGDARGESEMRPTRERDLCYIGRDICIHFHGVSSPLG